MPRYADPDRCPDCHASLAPPRATCGSCGLRLLGPDAAALFTTLTRADQLLAQLRHQAVPGAPADPDEARDDLPADIRGSGVFSSGRATRETLRPEPGRQDSGHQGLSGRSVQRMLLWLGAVCLLVAALTFLAVAWQLLGVSGRTGVLIGLTVIVSGMGALLASRGLRTAAEALTSVGLGLLALDLYGAENAGWFVGVFGEMSAPALLFLVGTLVAAVAGATALAMRGTRELVAPQAAVLLGLTAGGTGAANVAGSPVATLAATTAIMLAIAYLARLVGLTYLPWAALGGFTLWLLGLLGAGLFRALEHASIHALWLEAHVWPLLAAALLAGGPAMFSWLPRAIRIASVSASASIGTLVGIIPATDNGVTDLVLATLVALIGWSMAVLNLSGARRLAGYAPLLISAGMPATAGASLAVASVSSVLITLGREPTGIWVAEPSVRHVPTATEAHPLLLVPVVIALVAAAATVRTRNRRAATSWLLGNRATLIAVLVLAAIGCAGLYPVPVAALVLSLLGLAGGVVGWARKNQNLSGQLGAGAVGLAALVTALPSDWLSLGVLVPAVLATALAIRARSPIVRAVGEVLLPMGLAGLLWTVAEVANVEVAWRAGPVLLAVGGVAMIRPRVRLETSAAGAGAIAAFAAVGAAGDTPSTLAIHLTLAGALLIGSSLLHADRRRLGWGGGLLLAMATWVRLWDIEVRAPEAYTLPSAVALATVGLWHLRQQPSAATRLALGPALTLATVPSLLRVLAEPISLRAMLLGIACLFLVLAGVKLRWSAPLAVGATVGGTLVLREAVPYSAALPSWVLIGAAGMCLMGVGITWEARRANAVSAASYVARLR
ncbi:MAG: DUF2157 domain-containing protein [Nocardioides sp.]